MIDKFGKTAFDYAETQEMKHVLMEESRIRALVTFAKVIKVMFLRLPRTVSHKSCTYIHVVALAIVENINRHDLTVNNDVAAIRKSCFAFVPKIDEMEE